MTLTSSAALKGGATDGGRGPWYLSDLSGRHLLAPGGQRLGRLSDVIVHLRGTEYPPVSGLVARVGRRVVFVPAGQAATFTDHAIQLVSATFDVRTFERRDGEVLLRADVLSHRLIDVRNGRLVRATDLRLSRTAGGWVLDAVDTRRPPLPLPGRHARVHADRDWREFEPLIGDVRSAILRRPFARIIRLRPAQIADLLEDASKAEGAEILGRVRADPELEADVFEALDEDLATRLLGARTNAEIAGVLARMCADDAADTISDLPQGRRQAVLDLLPPGQRVKVTTLLGFNASSAGGLMSLDYLALPGTATVGDALAAVARSGGVQPEALTSVHGVDAAGRLLGVARLGSLVQADRGAGLAAVCDRDPVRIGPDADLTDVAVLMTDYNLTTIPVVDARRRLLGLITVDDVLEATLPDDWRRREAAGPPDARDVDGTAAPGDHGSSRPGEGP